LERQKHPSFQSNLWAAIAWREKNSDWTRPLLRIRPWCRSHPSDGRHLHCDRGSDSADAGPQNYSGVIIINLIYSHFYFLSTDGLNIGNRITSFIEGAPLNNMQRRSTPQPHPAVGGIPISRASTNSWSFRHSSSSSPPRPV
jgi:hypothetical protein